MELQRIDQNNEIGVKSSRPKWSEKGFSELTSAIITLLPLDSFLPLLPSFSFLWSSLFMNICLEWSLLIYTP